MSTQVEPDELQTKLGENVRKRREQLGLTQEALAEKMNTYESYISAVENGHRSPRLPNLAIFADALETTPSALLK